MTAAGTNAVGRRGVEVPFDALPELGSSGLRHAWDVFGRDDEIGTLNRVTAEATRAAAALVRTGERVSLDLPITIPDPPLFNRQPVSHVVYELDRNTWDDRLDGLQLQGSTQWDGLRHIRAREFGFYGGWQGPPDSEPTRLGIAHWTDHGIVTRGVLVDLTGGDSLDPFRTRAFTAEQLADAVATQCGPLRPGDVLCIRTGWTSRYQAMTAEQRRALAARDADAATRQWAGLAGSDDMARFLWDAGVAAVVCDNPALEVAPGDPRVGDLHRRLIPCLGFAVGELFALDGLLAACRRLGRREFLFVSVPMKLAGGVGSPGNAVAVL
ncbi:MAG TPA: cyclase family protein [Mycobacteriales bacterium]|jgi:kynurenine formamidase|nr:cyclase family protein [Mycobacteriales bacterium]